MLRTIVSVTANSPLCYNDVTLDFLHLLEKKLYCIYVAIGQKRSTVAQIVKRLTDTGNDD